MPKKSASARGGAQRNRPKVQKSIELVRQTIEEKNPFEDPTAEAETADVDESTSTNTSTVVTLEAPSKSTKTDTVKKNVAAPRSVSSVQKGTSTGQEGGSREPEKPMASRPAARLQTGQKTPQRVAVSLISAEHYSYVRNELMIIAILAVLFFAVIIILKFVPGIGG